MPQTIEKSAKVSKTLCVQSNNKATMAFAEPERVCTTCPDSVTLCDSGILIKQGETLRMVHFGKNTDQTMRLPNVCAGFESAALYEEGPESWLVLVGEKLVVSKGRNASVRASLEDKVPKRLHICGSLVVVTGKVKCTWTEIKADNSTCHEVTKGFIVDSCVEKKVIFLLIRRDGGDFEVQTYDTPSRVSKTIWQGPSVDTPLRLWSSGSSCFILFEKQVEQDSRSETKLIISSLEPVEGKLLPCVNLADVSILPIRGVEYSALTKMFYIATACSVISLCSFTWVVVQHIQTRPKTTPLVSLHLAEQTTFGTDRIAFNAKSRKLMLIDDLGVWTFRMEQVTMPKDTANLLALWKKSVQSLEESKFDALDSRKVRDAALMALWSHIGERENDRNLEYIGKRNVITSLDDVRTANELQSRMLVSLDPFALFYSNPKKASRLSLLLQSARAQDASCVVICCGNYIVCMTKVTVNNRGRATLVVELDKHQGDFLLADERFFGYSIQHLTRFCLQYGGEKPGLLLRGIPPAYEEALRNAKVQVSSEAKCAMIHEPVVEYPIAPWTEPVPLGTLFPRKRHHTEAKNDYEQVKEHLQIFDIPIVPVRVGSMGVRVSALDLVGMFSCSPRTAEFVHAFLKSMRSIFCRETNETDESLRRKWSLTLIHDETGCYRSILRDWHENQSGLGRLKNARLRFENLLFVYNPLSLDEAMEMDFSKAAAHVIPTSPREFFDKIEDGSMDVNDLVLALLQLYLCVKIVVVDCGSASVRIEYDHPSIEIAKSMWIFGEYDEIVDRPPPTESDEEDDEDVGYWPIVNLFHLHEPQEEYGLLVTAGSRETILKFNVIRMLEEGVSALWVPHPRSWKVF